MQKVFLPTVNQVEEEKTFSSRAMSSHTQTPYVVFSDPHERRALDRNTLHNSTRKNISTGAFGSKMYVDDASEPAHWMCSPGRDPRVQYIFGVERTTHPDHFSRFGYGRGWNGYVYGHSPGKYNDNPDTMTIHRPAGMAPARFYEGTHSSNYTEDADDVYDVASYGNEREKMMKSLPRG